MPGAYVETAKKVAICVAEKHQTSSGSMAFPPGGLSASSNLMSAQLSCSRV